MYKKLSWDSQLFGFSVAKIVNHIDNRKLVKELSILKKDDVKLVYCFTKQELDKKIVSNNNGVHLGCKITYCAKLRSDSIMGLATEHTQPFSKGMSFEDMKKLAIQSGAYSRYAVDPTMPKDLFHKLYTIWINRSISHEIADEVFVIFKCGHVVGMVTVKKENECGSIGLLAVDEKYRGKGYGRELVEIAKNWFRENSCICSKVITQLQNNQACHLYQSSGFRIEKVENVYHFWL